MAESMGKYVQKRQDLRFQAANVENKAVQFIIVLYANDPHLVILLSFCRPISCHQPKNCFLLVYVKHLTGWPIFKATVRATAERFISFLNSELLLPFGAPKVISSNNVASSNARKY